MSPPALPPPFLERVRAELPAEMLSTEAADLVEYGRDWTRDVPPAPAAVAFPRRTEEVSRLLSLCHAFDVKVVPSGGRTGLAGGAVAARGELVLSLTRMRAMDPVDVVGATVRVEAGAVTQAVHAHVAPHGYTWPVDFASKGSSTVGGNLATNAGGVRVVRHGLTRQWVLGLEVVLADGTVIAPGGALEKNNTGVDLRQLFIGSEGTLGVITAATLKLAPLPPRADVMLLGTSDLPSVLRLFHHARTSAPRPLAAFEVWSDRCLSRLMRHRGAAPPLSSRFAEYVLIELESGGASTPPEVLAWLADVVDRGLCGDAVVAQSPRQATELWALREGISEALSATGVPHKNDIALPIAELPAWVAGFERLVDSEYPGFELCVFGHIGDGNLHVNVMKPENLGIDEFLARAKALDHAMFALVRQHHGSISAEHGVGLLKRAFLGYTRSDEEIALQRAIKQALDPKGILNPGKILAS